MSSTDRDIRLRAVDNTPLSRSPHPYHRRSISLRAEDGFSSSTDVPTTERFFRASDSSEDHAAEADDEKGPLLRLPAPPIRARKGLKGVHDPSVDETPAISPLPTPSREEPGFSLKAANDVQPSQAKQQQPDELYERYLKRRRTEVVRRLTETLLLLVICALAACEQGTRVNPSLLVWTSELKDFLIVFSGCYILFPIRKSYQLYRSGVAVRTAARNGFHVPSRFDPGILLYPLLLPLSVTWSLKQYGLPILVNITLGLASMPTTVVPDFGKFHVFWVLSLLPVSNLPLFRHQQSTLKLPNADSSTVQEISLLFPLHQTLTTVIFNLVTTSLDPSEIQLLSVGLINLLLFASTPQCEILKALLWIGGLCLFILCEAVLKAEVALARIPAWRFARNKPSRKGMRGRINRILKAVLPESRSRFAAIASSDDEDATSALLHPPRRVRKNRIKILHEDVTEGPLQKTLSADEKGGNGQVGTAPLFPRTSRAYTFSTFGRAAQLAVKWRNIANSSNPYLRLNFLHAQALKLALAVYTYIAAAGVILVPVRYFISHRALRGAEPLGWAIGYFIGDIPQIRMWVVYNNLDWWIKLPLNRAQIDLPPDSGWVERYRQQILGAANTRLLLAGYCMLVVGLGIAAVLQLQKVVEVDTRRKVFHGVMVAMLLPTIPVDPCFFSLALMIVLAVFLMLDLFRASQVPPISKPLTNFLAPYVDGRDYRGPVIVSHIFLLIGCAIPLWLSLASTERLGQGPWTGWDVASRDLSMVSGVVCVGMGDAAASLIGRRYGKTKWYWAGGKSIEGSAAFAAAVMMGLIASWLWLRVGGWVPFDLTELPLAVLKTGLAGAGASVMESTLTAANDNVVVPVGLWLLVRGLSI